MQNFKQYLQEAPIDFAPWHIKTGKLKPEWEKNKIIPNKNGTYRVVGYIATDKAFGKDVDKFPIKLSSVSDSINIEGKFTSLWGFPNTVKYAAWINCPELEYLDHITSSVGELSLDLPKLKSIEPNMFICKILTIRDIGNIELSEIIKKIKVTKTVNIAENYLFTHRNILSLLKLPNNIQIYFAHYGDTKISDQYWREALQVQDIVQKHLKGDRNILKCQKELIQNGFKDYAKL